MHAHKRESRKFKSHGLKAIGCLEMQSRAQWTDFFMVCNMATKKSGFPEKPVEKIWFENFKKLSVYIFWPNLMNFGYCIHLAKVFESYY